MDALDGWNNLTPGWYTVDFMNNQTVSLAIKRFISAHSGGVVYMIDVNDVVYNWNNVLKVTKTGVMATHKELREICKCINEKRNFEQKAFCLLIGRCEMDTPSFRRGQNVALLQELISDDKPEEVNE